MSVSAKQKINEKLLANTRSILRHPKFVNGTTAYQGSILKQLVDGGLDPSDLISLQIETLDAPEINFRTTIAALGKDPLFLVIKNLDARSLVRLCSTDKRFTLFCKTHRDAIWKYILQRDFPDRAKPFTPYLKWLLANKGPYDYYKYVSQPPKLVSMSPQVCREATGKPPTSPFNADLTQFTNYINLNLAPRLNMIYPPIFPGDTIWLSPGNNRLVWDGEKFTLKVVLTNPENILQIPHARVQQPYEDQSPKPPVVENEASEARVSRARVILRHSTFLTGSANVQNSIINTLISKGLTADELTRARAP